MRPATSILNVGNTDAVADADAASIWSSSVYQMERVVLVLLLMFILSLSIHRFQVHSIISISIIYDTTTFCVHDSVPAYNLNVGDTNAATATDTFRVHCFCFIRAESILFRHSLQLLTVLQYTSIYHHQHYNDIVTFHVHRFWFYLSQVIPTLSPITFNLISMIHMWW